MSSDRVGAGGVLAGTRVEKAAQDDGFDLTPVREGNWMIYRSSAFPQALGVLAQSGGSCGISFSVVAWGCKVAKDCATDARIDAGWWPAVVALSLAARSCMP